MPDFERLFDLLRVDASLTKEQRSYGLGYIDGKNRARREIVIVVLIIAMIIVAGAIIGF